MAVHFVPSEAYTNLLQRKPREASHAVVRLLRHGCAFIAKSFEDPGREFGPFQFLQQQDLGLMLLQPRRNVVQACANRVYVPARNIDDSLLG